MDKYKKIEIDKKLDRISEIKKASFLSDEELQEINKLEQEVRELKGEPSPEHYEEAIISEVNPNIDSTIQESEKDQSIQPVQVEPSHHLINEDELQAKIDKERTEKIKARTKKDNEDHNKDQIVEQSMQEEDKIPTGVAEEMLKNLRLKEKRLRELLAIEQVKDNIAGLEKKLYETIKEQNYVISKRDEKGLVTVNKDLYHKKIKELEFELEHTEGFMNRWKIKSKISDLKNAKRFAHLSNGMIKVSGKFMSISNTISKAGNELSKLDRLSQPVQDKKKKQKKKKSKQEQKEYDEEQKRTEDYGFNMKNFLGQSSSGKSKVKDSDWFETDWKM